MDEKKKQNQPRRPVGRILSGKYDEIEPGLRPIFVAGFGERLAAYEETLPVGGVIRWTAELLP